MTPYTTARDAALRLSSDDLIRLMMDVTCERFGDNWRVQDSFNATHDAIERLQVDVDRAAEDAFIDRPLPPLVWDQRTGFVGHF